jgi:hypothetical protein
VTAIRLQKIDETNRGITTTSLQGTNVTSCMNTRPVLAGGAAPLIS